MTLLSVALQRNAAMANKAAMAERKKGGGGEREGEKRTKKRPQVDNHAGDGVQGPFGRKVRGALNAEMGER